MGIRRGGGDVLPILARHPGRKTAGFHRRYPRGTIKPRSPAAKTPRGNTATAKIRRTDIALPVSGCRLPLYRSARAQPPKRGNQDAAALFLISNAAWEPD